MRGRLVWIGGRCSLATPRGASRALLLVSREQITRAFGTFSAIISGFATIGVSGIGKPERAAGALARSGVAVTSVTVCWERAAHDI